MNEWVYYGRWTTN